MQKKIVRMKADDYSVVESVFKTFLEVKNFSGLIDCYEIISEELKENARIKMYLAVAYSIPVLPKRRKKFLLHTAVFRLVITVREIKC